MSLSHRKRKFTSSLFKKENLCACVRQQEDLQGMGEIKKLYSRKERRKLRSFFFSPKLSLELPEKEKSTSRKIEIRRKIWLRTVIWQKKPRQLSNWNRTRFNFCLCAIIFISLHNLRALTFLSIWTKFWKILG